MTDKPFKPITHTFTQTGWGHDTSPNSHRARVIELLVALDMLEADVYADRDFNLANEMLHAIRIKTLPEGS